VRPAETPGCETEIARVAAAAGWATG
jgi:hypothetical protein